MDECKTSKIQTEALINEFQLCSKLWELNDKIGNVRVTANEKFVDSSLAKKLHEYIEEKKELLGNLLKETQIEEDKE